MQSKPIAHSMKHGTDGSFWPGVASPYARHHVRSLRFAENISHGVSIYSCNEKPNSLARVRIRAPCTTCLSLGALL